MFRSYDTIMSTITEHEYSCFQRAYDFFNQALFGGELPEVMVTLQRGPKFRGYFWAEKFGSRDGMVKAHELAMNPDTFEGRSDECILSTLVHEMVHVWQQEHGDPPRRAYHDKEWAGKMDAVGLVPSSSGEPGGKRTGQHMSHWIEEGGRYQLAYRELSADGFTLSWQSIRQLKGASKKAASKTKYTCPLCKSNAWAKPDTSLMCGDCSEPLKAVAA